MMVKKKNGREDVKREASNREVNRVVIEGSTKELGRQPLVLMYNLTSASSLTVGPACSGRSPDIEELIDKKTLLCFC